MTELIERLRDFEGSDELGNGDFSLLSEAAAEIEALRAEVERLKRHAERQHAAYWRANRRAERLLEALRWAERHCPCGARPESPDTHPHVPGCLIGAALAQEDRND